MIIKGAGGKGSKGGASEDPNTLQTNNVFRGLYLVSEGPIEGFATADGAKSIYFNDVVLKDSNNDFGFEGVSYTLRTGLPDQQYISGFDSAKSIVGVEQTVTTSTPQAVTIAGAFDAVIVTIAIPQLTFLDPDKGALKGTDLRYAIDVKTATGAYVTVIDENLIKQKTVTRYERDYRIDLPSGGSPWTVRVRRITPNSTDANLSNTLIFARYATVVDGKFTYRHTSVLGVELNAKQFGDTVPKVSANLKGLKIWVPRNYNPVTRTYATTGPGTSGGIWDGTFKAAYSNNPAWCFFDLITNNRYGVGQLINPDDDIENAYTDKFNLYIIGQYCDQLVNDGEGGTEPRYTFNAYIKDRMAAYEAIQKMLSVFRAMPYFSSNQIYISADMPGTVEAVFTQANVDRGLFSYSSSALKTRSTVVYVSWRNPANLYKQEIEIYEDLDAIREFGYREKSIDGFGVTSRGQAQRLAKWTLLTEKTQTQTVSFKTGLEGALLNPGSLIKIVDNARAGVRYGGRILAAQNLVAPLRTQYTIDAPVTLQSGVTYEMNVVLPDKSIGTYTITTAASTTDVITVTGSQPLPQEFATWFITEPNVNPLLARVLSVTESERGVYSVTALQHNPNKDTEIETGISFPVQQTSVLNNTRLEPPTNVETQVWYQPVLGSEYEPRVTASWRRPPDSRVERYEVQLQTDTKGFETVAITPSISLDTLKVQPDNTVDLSGNPTVLNQIRVRSLDGLGRYSDWAYSDEFPVTGFPDAPAAPTDLTAVGTFNAVDLRWVNTTEPDFKHVEIYRNTVDEFYDPLASPPYDDGDIVAIKIAETSSTNYVDTPVPAATPYFYWVRTISNSQINFKSVPTASVTATALGITSGDLDTTPPAVPTDLSLTSEVKTDIGVTQYTELSSTWTPPVDADLVGYDFAVKEGIAGNFVAYRTTEPRFVFRGKGNTTYYVKVRALDKVNNASAYTAEVSHTTALDTTAPAAPTGLTASAGQFVIDLLWTNPSAIDLSHIEIYENTVNTLPGTASFTIPATPSTIQRFSRTGLASGAQRFYWLKAVDTSGNASVATTSVNATALGVSGGDLDTTPPGVPTLSVPTITRTYDFDNNAVYTLDATWTIPPDSDLAGYDVQVKAGIGGAYTGYKVNSNNFSLLVQAGIAYYVRVRAFDRTGNVSSYSVEQNATFSDTTAPATISDLSAIALNKAARLNWTNPSDRDVATYEVWRNTTGTTPNPATDLSMRVASNATSFSLIVTYTDENLADNTTYYYWVTTVDTAGNRSAFSNRPTVSTGSLIDVTPPAVPTGLALTSLGAYDATNTFIVRLFANWNAVADSDLSGYDLQLRENGGNWVSFLTNTNMYELIVRPNTLFEARLRSFDRSDNRSAFTSIVSHTSTRDTVAPAVPTSLSVSASLTSLFLSWTNPADSDLDKIEIWENTSNNSGTATRIATVNAIPSATGGFSRSGLGSGVQRFYWLKAVDSSGNVSGFSTGSNGTTARVAQVDVTSGLTIPQSVNVTNMNTVAGTAGALAYNAFDQKLYRYVSGSPPSAVWTATVTAPEITGTLSDSQLAAISAAKITGQIVSTQITDGAISTPKLAAGSVTAAQIAADTITAAQIAANAITASELAANAVTADKINANAVTADKIAANSITAAKIVSGSITSTEIAANTITAANIAAGTITGTQIAAGSINADRITAGTITGDRFLTTTSLPGTITVGVTGVSIGTVQSQAANPASVINGAATTIDPGKILISGATTLANWRNGTDTTKIEGGNIAANTISANQLRVGAQGIVTDQISFSTSGASGHTINWTAGAIYYTNTSGTRTRVTTSSGSSTHVSPGTSVMTIYWVKDAASLSVTYNAESLTGDIVILATFTGFHTINVMAGYTVIEGSRITTGSILAGQIAANAITADKIEANAITVGKIADGAVSTVKIADGSISANKIQTDAVTADKIQANAITAVKIQANAVTTDKINAGAITAVKISAGSIDASRLTVSARSGVSFPYVKFTASGTTLSWTSGFAVYDVGSGLGAGQAISGGSVNYTGTPLYLYWQEGSSSITATTDPNAPFSTNRVYIGWYNSGEDFYTSQGNTVIGNGFIQTNAISADKIQAGAIIADKIAANAVTADKINANAITVGKIADGAVSTVKIADGAITANKIQANSITSAQISAGGINADRITAGTITADRIILNGVTTDRIATNAISEYGFTTLNPAGLTSSFVSRGSVTVSYPSGATILAIVTADMDCNSGLDNGYNVGQVRFGGTVNSQFVTHYQLSANYTGSVQIGGVAQLLDMTGMNQYTRNVVTFTGITTAGSAGSVTVHADFATVGGAGQLYAGNLIVLVLKR